MEKFDVVSAVAAPYPFANVDTDRIIRIERCARTPREQMGAWAFEMERFDAQGRPAPDFVLHREPFLHAGILVAGENFGCGSSREMAVWALQGLGMRCLIAPSFGEIFFGNCFQNGVLPIRLPTDTVEDLQHRLARASHAAQATLSVDLPRQQVHTPWGQEIAFDIEPLRKEALLDGLDAIALTLRKREAIDAFQARQRLQQPWVWPA